MNNLECSRVSAFLRLVTLSGEWKNQLDADENLNAQTLFAMRVYFFVAGIVCFVRIQCIRRVNNILINVFIAANFLAINESVRFVSHETGISNRLNLYARGLAENFEERFTIRMFFEL